MKKNLPSDVWCGWSDEQTIKTIRTIYGMSKVGTKECQCTRCKLPYQSQTLNGRRTQFFCYDCQVWQGEQSGLL